MDVVTCALNILNHNVAVAVICDNDKFPSNLSPDTIYDTVACVIHKEAIATRLCLELFSNPGEEAYVLSRCISILTSTSVNEPISRL